MVAEEEEEEVVVVETPKAWLTLREGPSLTVELRGAEVWSFSTELRLQQQRCCGVWSGLLGALLAPRTQPTSVLQIQSSRKGPNSAINCIRH